MDGDVVFGVDERCYDLGFGFCECPGDLPGQVGCVQDIDVDERFFGYIGRILHCYRNGRPSRGAKILPIGQLSGGYVPCSLACGDCPSVRVADGGVSREVSEVRFKVRNIRRIEGLVLQVADNGADLLRVALGVGSSLDNVFAPYTDGGVLRDQVAPVVLLGKDQERHRIPHLLQKGRGKNGHVLPTPRFLPERLDRIPVPAVGDILGKSARPVPLHECRRIPDGVVVPPSVLYRLLQDVVCNAADGPGIAVRRYIPGDGVAGRHIGGDARVSQSECVVGGVCDDGRVGERPVPVGPVEHECLLILSL